MIDDIKALREGVEKLNGNIGELLAGRNVRVRVPDYDNRALLVRGECVQNVQLANDLLASSQACKFLRLVGFNSSASVDAYVQIWDIHQIPSSTEGRTPIFAFPAFANRNFSLDMALIPWDFQAGVYVCASSTLATLTLLTSKAFKFNVQVLHDAPN